MDDDNQSEPWKSGSLYGVMKPLANATLAPGQWNTGGLLVRGAVTEHYINDHLVCRYDFDSAGYRELRSESKYIAATNEEFATAKRGSIGLQFQGGEVFYRNLRVQALEPAGKERQTASPKQSLDLLALMDGARDKRGASGTKGNRWERRGAALAYVSDGGCGEIAVSVQISSQFYQLELEFSAQFDASDPANNRVHTYLPQRDGTHIPIRFFADGSVSLGGAAVKLHWSAKPANAGRIAIRVDRRVAGKLRLEILNDGKLIDSWEGDPASIEGTMTSHSLYGARSVPALYSAKTDAEFRNFRLTLYEGEATVLK